MAGKEVGARWRHERDGDERRRPRDEAVEYDRQSRRGAAEDDADEARDLEAADARQRR